MKVVQWRILFFFLIPSAANFMYFVAYTTQSLVLLVGSRFIVGESISY